MSIFPSCFALETTTRCNASCSFCMRRRIKRGHGEMSVELFDKIMRQLPEGSWVVPHIWNEPLEDTRFWDLMNLVPSCCSVLLYTNGSLVAGDSLQGLSTHPLVKRIYVSFNGWDKESYESSMFGLDFDVTVANVLALVSLERENKSEVHLSVIVPREKQSSEVYGLLDKIFPMRLFSTCAIYNPFQIRSGTEDPNPRNLACSRPFFYMSILWDGRVCLCCDDYDGEEILGDLNRDTVESVWFSPRMIEIRRAHLIGRVKDIAVCRNCDEPPRCQHHMGVYRDHFSDVLEAM